MGQVYSRFIAFITFFEFLYSGPQDPGFWGLWNSGFGAVEARLWGLQKHGCGDCGHETGLSKKCGQHIGGTFQKSRG
jgi:hypothetical protein